MVFAALGDHGKFLATHGCSYRTVLMACDLVQCQRRESSSHSPRCSLRYCAGCNMCAGHSSQALDSDQYILACFLLQSHVISIPAHPHEPLSPKTLHGFISTPAASPSTPEHFPPSAKAPAEDPPEDPPHHNLAMPHNITPFPPGDSNLDKRDWILGCLAVCATFLLFINAPGSLRPPSPEETVFSTGWDYSFPPSYTLSHTS